MADLINIVDRLSRRLGAARGEPVPRDGGITNRNYRVRFGERDCVLRLPGRDTELLGIARAAERVGIERAAALGIAPRSSPPTTPARVGRTSLVCGDRRRGDRHPDHRRPL
jgi:hypothetical protein